MIQVFPGFALSVSWTRSFPLPNSQILEEEESGPRASSEEVPVKLFRERIFVESPPSATKISSVADSRPTAKARGRRLDDRNWVEGERRVHVVVSGKSKQPRSRRECDQVSISRTSPVPAHCAHFRSLNLLLPRICRVLRLTALTRARFG